MQNSPIITKMQVIPVAGYDGMLMTLSGAHAPCFTRNLVVLTDNAGHPIRFAVNCCKKAALRFPVNV